MRIGSLCSGYEGLGMAVQSVLGGELAWVADNDTGASKILAHRFPGVPNLGDIAAAEWSSAGPVDIVTAGFPCQDISYAGRGEGIREGNRSGLWYAIADALGVLRPRIVVLENVAGIVGRRPGLDVVLGDLARLGFDAEWLCLRAADIGACHGRPRFFIVAYLAADADRAIGDQRRLAAPGQAESGRPRADAGGRGGASAADTDGTGCAPRLESPPRWRQGGGTGAPVDRAGRDRGHALADPARDGLARRPERDREPQVGRPGHEQRRVAPLRRVLDWGIYELAIRRWEKAFGQPAPRPTEPRRTGERLSPRFVEWMMGLPDGWVTDVPGLSSNDQLKALGNGVVPQQAAAALSVLLDRAAISPLVAADRGAA